MSAPVPAASSAAARTRETDVAHAGSLIAKVASLKCMQQLDVWSKATYPVVVLRAIEPNRDIDCVLRAK